MTTFNPYQSGGATKTVVTPNFSSYGLANSYSNFTPAGQTPQQISTLPHRPNPIHHHRAPGANKPKRPFSYDGMGSKNRMAWFARNPDKVTRFHCEICCCDCLGKDSWRAHLKGQQHVKKVKLAEKQGKRIPANMYLNGGNEEEMGDSIESISPTGGSAATASALPPPPNFCEICNCHCTNADAFAAHLRGQKHQRALSLHTKMGKPIPGSLQQQQQVFKVIPTTNLTSVPLGSAQMQASGLSGQSSSSVPGGVGGGGGSVVSLSSSSDRPSVGVEWIQEEKDSMGRVVNYKCELCKCDMNNVYMRDEHLKGRKHLTEFKMKIQPNLKVADPKLQSEFNRIERVRQQNEQEELKRRQVRENNMIAKIRSREHELLKAYPNCCQVSEYRSTDDNLITAKHLEINPPPMELKVADSFLMNIETCLKAVAEKLAADHEHKTKELKGVMRVGYLAKNILLKGEKQLELVVLCDKKPTEVLAANVCHVLNDKLEELITDETFLVSWSAKNAWITVKSKSESALQCTVHITSPEMREPDTLDGNNGHERILDQAKCAASLADTRRAKWFDLKCKSQPTLCLVVRILRDLCRRIPTWNSFPCYIMELICDKALRTVAHQMGPAELLRRFFEIIASGLLLPGEAGVLDPCEKSNSNAARVVKLQDCQDITTSSQHALRLIALGQTDKILGTTDKKRKVVEHELAGDIEETTEKHSAAAGKSSGNTVESESVADHLVTAEKKDGNPQPPPAKKECTQAAQS